MIVIINQGWNRYKLLTSTKGNFEGCQPKGNIKGLCSRQCMPSSLESSQNWGQHSSQVLMGNVDMQHANSINNQQLCFTQTTVDITRTYTWGFIADNPWNEGQQAVSSLCSSMYVNEWPYQVVQGQGRLYSWRDKYNRWWTLYNTKHKFS